MTESLEPIIKKLNIGNYKRHILFCGGPKCCAEDDGEKVWMHLKERSKELANNGVAIFRTKVKCLRICQQGPIALVYPEGTWYRCVDKQMCDRIIDEHLIQGKPVEDAVIARNPL